jgi:hypothetical protein
VSGACSTHGEIRNLLENLKGGDVGVDGRIILEWMLENCLGGGGRCGLDSSGSVAGSYKHGNESSGSMKGAEFID